MDNQDFIETLDEDFLPKGLSAPLSSLWYDAKGNWNQAHDIAQEIPGKEGALVHAYLHRKEGDLWNAEYWYRNAGVRIPGLTLDEEWQELVHRFLI